MKTLVALACSLSCLLSFGQLGQTDVTVKKTLKLMGTRFEITVVAPNEEIGYINIDEAVSEIERIERIISSWDENSETSLINKLNKDLSMSKKFNDMIRYTRVKKGVDNEDIEDILNKYDKKRNKIYFLDLKFS